MKQKIWIHSRQRILLELTWSCLEDANYLPSYLRGSDTGVFIGACNFDYKELAEKQPIVGGHLVTGIHLSFLANRISHIYDFHGPSTTLDAACASSLFP